MKIAIIGAGISGLTAGRELARAGHDITVIEKSRGVGGRLATRYAGLENKTRLDHGLSSFSVESDEFGGFVSELLEQDLVRVWGDQIALHDGEQLYPENPNARTSPRYIAENGMNSIGKYLSRWADVKIGEKAGGLTYFGPNRSKKRAWMINLTSFNTFEADAVILALPAPQAYGVILTCQDEIDTLRIIRKIDEIHYEPAWSLMAGYGEQNHPGWNGITCLDKDISFISNEGSKRDNPECALVFRSTPEFARKYRDSGTEEIKSRLLDKAGVIAGEWCRTPEWSQLHYWRYHRAISWLPVPFLDFDGLDSPLALTGDFFNGNTVDSAYRSGVLLARNWIRKFEKAEA